MRATQMSIKNKLSNIFIFLVAVIRYEFIFIIALICLISSIYIVKDAQGSNADSFNQHDKPCQTNTSKQSIKDEVIHLCQFDKDK